MESSAILNKYTFEFEGHRYLMLGRMPKVFYWSYTFNYNGFIIPMVGIVINKSLKDHPKKQNLINHEIIHWAQYKKYTVVLFLFLYLCDILYHGYDLSLFEIEARYNENKWVKYNYTAAVRIGKANTPENPNFRKGKRVKFPNI